MYNIPLFGINRLYRAHTAEFADVANEVLLTGKLLDGKFTAEFEKAIANRCNRKYAISVNSGTQAIIFTLMYYLQNTKNTNVIVPDISFIASANASIIAGGAPIFADVNANGLLDVRSLTKDVTASASMLMYVNLCGNIVNYEHLSVVANNHKLILIEDAAQSFGAKWNGIPSGKGGNASIFSFDPTKNLPNFGSGGMVLTDDLLLAEYVSNLKDNGKKSSHSLHGTNSKMSEVDCAQMLVKLKYFDQWQLRRTAIAEYYSATLKEYVSVPAPEENVTHAWSKYIINTSRRDHLFAVLANNNIESKINYPHPLHSYKITQSCCNNINAAKYCQTCLALPIYPELSDAEVEHVASTIVTNL